MKTRPTLFPTAAKVAYDNCPPAASHTCSECRRVVPRCPQCGDAIGHALRPCQMCNPATSPAPTANGAS